MISGIGNDIIEVERIAKAIERHPKAFIDKIFTLREQNYCQKYKENARHYAGRFAAKEAVLKALGTGVIEGVSWLDIEILNDQLGKPYVLLSDRIKVRLGDLKIEISISHCKDYATAMAIAITE